MNASVIPAKALLLLSATLLTLFLAACGSDEGDLDPPALTVNAVNPITVEPDRFLSGTLEAGSALEVLVDTTATVTDLVVAGETWSCVVRSLVPGFNNVSVVAEDSRGNTRTIIASLFYTTFTLERVTSPTPLAAQTVGGRLAPGASITVDLTPAGASSPTTCIADTSQPTRWKCDLSGLAVGSNTLAITATDPLGRAASGTSTITGDLIALDVAIDPVSTPTRTALVTLSGDRTTDATISVLASSTASIGTIDTTTAPTRWSVPVTLARGPNPFTVTVSDGVNPISTAAVTITLDEIAPRVIGAAISGGNPTATFSETMDSTSANAAVSVTDALGFPVTGTSSYTLATRAVTFTPSTALTPGNAYTVSVATTAVDLAGNPLPALFERALVAP